MAFIKEMDIVTPLKILLITSGQPSLNPRLVKEADALADAGYHVTVLYQYWNDWGTKMDTSLLKNKHWKAVRVGGQPGDIIYILTKIVYKIGKILAKYIGLNIGFAELAIGRGSWLLSRKAFRSSADIYIAHNLAALPAAVKAAKKNHAKCGFDAEDFHRNEVSDDAGDFDVMLKTFIEKKYYPAADYITASSAEIASAYKQIFPQLNPVVVLNTFPANKGDHSELNRKEKTLKLLWFSQSVGLSRGIQDVLAAMKILEEEDIEFHILGDLSPNVYHELSRFVQILSFSRAPGIIYHDPLPSDELTGFAARFDIGLATEPGFSINNNIALSNKLFTYINAGLAVVASDTPAQSNFLKKYPEAGSSYQRQNAASLSEVLKRYINSPHLLSEAKMASRKIGQTELNWENERIKFLNAVKSVLNN